jgi:hypothetical protein
MSKIERPVLFVDLIKEDVNYKLTKPNDPSFLKTGEKAKWVRWNEDGTFKEWAPDIEIDASLVLNPHFGAVFTWMTTGATEVIEQNDNEIVFKTKNSLYKLEKAVSSPAADIKD